MSLITSSETPPPATLPFMLQPEGEVGWRGNRFRFLGRRRRAAPRCAGSCSPPGKGRAGPGRAAAAVRERPAAGSASLPPRGSLRARELLRLDGPGAGGLAVTVSSVRVRLTR